MSKKGKLLAAIQANPSDVRFDDLCKVCKSYFGDPSSSGSSHVVHKVPWAGDPRVNVQNKNGKAKTYQVRQVLEAIRKLEEIKRNEND